MFHFSHVQLVMFVHRDDSLQLLLDLLLPVALRHDVVQLVEKLDDGIYLSGCIKEIKDECSIGDRRQKCNIVSAIDLEPTVEGIRRPGIGMNGFETEGKYGLRNDDGVEYRCQSDECYNSNISIYGQRQYDVIQVDAWLECSLNSLVLHYVQFEKLHIHFVDFNNLFAA